MANPVNESSLDTYISDCKAVTQFSANHIKFAVAMVLVSAAIGAIAYCSLHYGLPQVGLSRGAAIVISIASANFVLAIALALISRHHTSHVKEVEAKAGAEPFLKALQQFIQRDTSNEHEETWNNYVKWMEKDFSDDNYEQLLCHLAKKLFDTNGNSNNEKETQKLYNHLYLADNIRFLKIYFKLLAKNALSTSYPFLKQYVDKKLSTFNSTAWAQLIDVIDPKETKLCQKFLTHPQLGNILQQTGGNSLSEAARIKLLVLIDHSCFRNKSLELSKIKKMCIEGAKWRFSDIKMYYRTRSSFSKKFREYLDETIDISLNTFTSSEWRQIIKTCDKQLIKCEVELTPFDLVERMSRLNRHKFDEAIGNGGFKGLLKTIPEIDAMSSSLRDWLDALHDNEVGAEAGREYK